MRGGQREPVASRPDMPEYGLLDADAGRGLLPWSWAIERLERARNFWLFTERADEAVIVEGSVELTADSAMLAPVAERYAAKYGMGYPPDSAVFAVRPRVAFGFIENAADFAGTATRWRFE